MKERIEKERVHLFSPYASVVTRVEIEGVIFEEKLREAIIRAVRNHEILNARVTIEKAGSAFYETQKFGRNPNELLRIVKNTYWKDIVKEQQKIAFDLDHGELVRFYYLINEDKQELLVIAHHLAGDGLSYGYLIEDIMRAMVGARIEPKPIKLYRKEQVPKESRLPFMMRMLLDGIERSWKKQGRSFDYEDYYRLYSRAWDNRETFILYESFYPAALEKIKSFAKENDITVNSVIAAAFARASAELKMTSKSQDEKEKKEAKPDDIGITVSVRQDLEKEIYKGMGNFATGISAAYLYDDNVSFAENARKLHMLITEKLTSVKDKYFLTQFMGALPETLIDAVYFQMFGEYENKTSDRLMNMMGYGGKPKGISLSNLTKLSIPVKYGSLVLKNYVFIPPLVPNARRMIGVVTFRDVMNISFHARLDEMAPNAKLFFQKGIEHLRSIN